MRTSLLLSMVVAVLPLSAFAQAPVVRPEKVVLDRTFERAQLVVSESQPDGKVTDRSADLTSASSFESSNPAVVSVSASGSLLAIGNGEATIKVTSQGRTLDVPVTVSNVTDKPTLDYVRDIAPVLNKAGCNMGACHAVQFGQAGFKLSVFAFDPDADRDAIVRDRQQRRTNFVEPEHSLFLMKPLMEVPHGGGKRLSADSVEYRTLLSWIRGGAPAPVKNPVKVTAVSVFPTQRVGKKGLTQQLRVEATYSDGTTRDVTALARYDSMDDSVLDVSGTGFVKTHGEGQAPVMIRFEGQAAISMFVIPWRDDVELAGWTNNNFVDELAAKKFRELGIEPSPLCDDATFLRRAYLDATGTAPSVAQTKTFLESSAADKRTQLIDELLGLTGDPNRDIHNDDYAAYWTLKWSDLVRNSSNGNNVDQAMWAMHNWMKETFRTNRPFDQFVKELVTAKGSIYMNGPANYFRIFRGSTDLTEATAQIFLGVRLECAKCHHHPFEKYGQEDYYSFAAFFSRVSTKTSEEFGLFGGEQVVIVRATGEVSHPRTGQRMSPTPLEGESVDHPLDRRIALADWLTSKNNTLFAKNVVNRYVRYLLGRGLVEPVDDLRSTNPPTNPELMDALAQQFRDSGFNIKQLMRSIMISRLYQLSSQPTETNQRDIRFYSHFQVKRLSAEPLLDAIDQVTESRTKYRNLPPGTKAIELPDAEYPDYFLNTFAKPRRASVCECERSPEENLAQALHTLNGDTLAVKLNDAKGRIARLLNEKKTPDEIITEFYLAALSRFPSGEEVATARDYVNSAPTPKEGFEDLLWSLMNSRYFLFVH